MIETCCEWCANPEALEYEFDNRLQRWVLDPLETYASGEFQWLCKICLKGVNQEVSHVRAS